MIVRSGVVALLAAAGAMGCGAVGSPAGSPRTGSATIIDADELESGGGTILNALGNHVSGLRIQQGDFCPEIVMRGRKSLVHPTNPLVYMDGVRASNTCVLESLHASQVQRVEVYPGGVTRRSGYQSHPGGLILIFMKGH